MDERNALAVMLKTPIPGRVKTRLTPPLTPSESSRLYTLFIKDIFSRVTLLKKTGLYAACAATPGLKTPPSRARNDFGAIIPAGVGVFPQKGATLGERLYNVFARLFKRGYGSVAVIGSDSPDMPLGFIEEAFKRLEDPSVDIVLGPAKDGGYYLIAMKRPVKEVFEGVRFSTPFALEDTIERTREMSLSLRLLPPWHDIDRPSDLLLLKNNRGAPLSGAFIQRTGVLI